MNNMFLSTLVVAGLLMSTASYAEIKDRKGNPFVNCFMEKPEKEGNQNKKEKSGDGFDISSYNSKFNDRINKMSAAHNKTISKMKAADADKNGYISHEEMANYCGLPVKNKSKNKSN